MLKLAFAGTPDFAARILRHLVASDHEVATVISQPDRRRGRGRKISPTPVAELARTLDLDLLQPEKISDADAVISEHDALIVAAYGQILRPPTLEAARLGAFNVHASVLPLYRGAAPIERAIMDGSTESGASIMKMDPGLDTGPVARISRIDIPPDMTGGELTDALAEIGGKALVEVMGEMESGRLNLSEQDSLKATYAAKVLPEDQELDWTGSASRVHDVVRALSPHIGARGRDTATGETIKLWRTRVAGPGVPKIEAGRIYVQNGEIYVGCGEGSVRVLELQMPGKRRMEAGEMLRGRDISGALLA